MKLEKFILVVSIFWLSSCTFYNVKRFVEPELGNLSYIKGSAKLKGLFLSGRKTHLTLYAGCEDALDAKPDRSDIVFQESEFDKKVAKIPSGNRLYFTYGTIDSKWDCRMPFSFVPEKSSTYRVDYKMVFGGCKVSVASADGSEIPSLRLYKDGFFKSRNSCQAFR